MMKYTLVLLILVLSMQTRAQVHNAENYNPGDQLHYMVCTMPASPGNAGYSIIWNFSSCQDSGNGQHTTWISEDTSTAANNDIIQSPTPSPTNGSRVLKTATQSLLMMYHAPPLTYTYDTGVLLIDREMIYGFADSNTYNSTLFLPNDTLTGGGSSKILADGIGTVKTPMGTFNNVIRVKRTADNSDSADGNSIRNVQVSYIWYDSVFTAPLFRIDSLYRTGTGTFQNITSTTATAQYLQNIFPAGISTQGRKSVNALGHLDDNGLALNAALTIGKSYLIALVNIYGQELYKTSFVADGAIQHFKPGINLPAGSYAAIISGLSGQDLPVLIRLVKE